MVREKAEVGLDLSHERDGWLLSAIVAIKKTLDAYALMYEATQPVNL
jgi:hypothetical protein